jgi:hypothetical protein
MVPSALYTKGAAERVLVQPEDNHGCISVKSCVHPKGFVFFSNQNPHGIISHRRRGRLYVVKNQDVMAG